MSNFRPINRDTGFLLPPSVDEWLPQRHLARFVVEVVDQLDLSELAKAYRGSGSASFHPASSTIGAYSTTHGRPARMTARGRESFAAMQPDLNAFIARCAEPPIPAAKTRKFLAFTAHGLRL